MRSDMHKVIVERPRRGMRMRKRFSRPGVDLESLPFRSGINRTFEGTGGTKSLNENLAPLRRYLVRQVGRRWDNVYSEICEYLDVNNTVKQHVRDHVEDLILVQTVRDSDGIIRDMNSWTKLDVYWSQEVFVDPNTGIIRRSDSLRSWREARENHWYWRGNRKRSRKETQSDSRVIDSDGELHNLGGIWYQIEFENPSETDFRKTGLEAGEGFTHERPLVYDQLERKLVSSRRRYANSKRQLSRAELRKYDLVND